ncbi:hypothetical protein GmHk_10G030300 [Glycine max]|nr:hypothetical protein GmHk_10G030300 [Glycine max]
MLLQKNPLCYLNLNLPNTPHLWREPQAEPSSPSPSLPPLPSRASLSSPNPPPLPPPPPLWSVAVATLETTAAKHSIFLERLRSRHLREAAKAGPELRKKAKVTATTAEARRHC